ncbi:Zn-dependent exopeptidase [Coprinopsis marcescibilis]|uniref:Peptide hydrolase n=1 Tax=Coprinopsis marcescibilis TaxID=230819 RepID=A0A5C3KS23_COPMA|nr:Zn-dependent exopeptidase [Coprinopsis marcescibilis]
MKVLLPLIALALSFPAFADPDVDIVDIEAAGVRPLRPLVDSERLQASISKNKLLGHAEKLLEFSKLSNNNRAFGSKGHNATVAYIKELLDATGFYDTHLETFVWPYSESNVSFSTEAKTYSTAPFTYGPGGDIEAPLVKVNNVGCTLEDFPQEVAGNVALILRGECEFGLKVAYAGAAGAAGAILYNNVNEGFGSGGTLAQPSRPEGPYVPVGGISGLEGKALMAALAEGQEVVGKIHATTFSEERYSSNVIATTKQGDKGNIIFAGAHSDSVPAGPGINDDGSGTISILEVALNLPRYRFKNAVRFGWWTAEEFGLVGSEYHVERLTDEQRQKIALYLNFDMLASPNSGYFVLDGDGSASGSPAPAGSDHIENVFLDWYEKRGLKTGQAAFSGSSDYDAFLNVGIPVGGVNTGASGVKTVEGAEWWGGEAGVAYDVCYHAICDTVDNLRVPIWEHNTKAAAHAIATYAKELPVGIPRERRASVASLLHDSMTYEERSHHACDHGVVTH